MIQAQREAGVRPGRAEPGGAGRAMGRRPGRVSVDAQCALDRKLPVRLAADADLHRPRQLAGVEAELELDIVPAALLELPRLGHLPARGPADRGDRLGPG